MNNTQKRINNPETLILLGQLLRQQRERLGVTQGKVKGMRQATVSKIENGGDVTLDTLITYAGAIGFEIALVPVGQGNLLNAASPKNDKPQDPLSEFSDLLDEDE